MAPHDQDDEDEASAPLIAASSHTTLPDEHASRGSADADESAGAPGSAKRHSRFREEMGDSEEDVCAEREGLRGEDGEEEEEGEVDESGMLRPGVFVWCLTLCAGVSGLLFGYEYVYSLIFLECTSWAKNSRCSTTWYDLTMRSTS